MASRRLIVKPQGLVTNVSNADRPPGAMNSSFYNSGSFETFVFSKNAGIEREGILTRRRGFADHGGSGISAPPSAIYTNKALAGRYFIATRTAASSSCAANTIRYAALGGAFADVSGIQSPVAFAATSAYRTRFTSFDGFPTVYCVGAGGAYPTVRRIGTDTGAVGGTPQAYSAGMPRGLAPFNSGIAGFGAAIFTNGDVADYRACWRLTTLEGQVIRGWPSPPYRNTITAATTNGPTISVPFPLAVWGTDYANANHRISNSYVVELYRTNYVTPTAEPTQDYRLVYEIQVGTADIAAQLFASATQAYGYINITDFAPDIYRATQPSLYTNRVDVALDDAAPVGGLAGEPWANNVPPKCKELATWRNRLWCANTAEPYQLEMQFIGTPTAGLTMTVGGRTYVAGAAAVLPLTWAYSASAVLTDNLRECAANLCRAINGDLSQTTVFAYPAYDETNPGRFYLVERSPAGTQFTVTFGSLASAQKMRPLNYTGTNYVLTSKTQTFANGIYWSKQGQPDAFPPAQYFICGPNGSEVMRLIPLRDQLFVFTTSGLYRITGLDENDFLRGRGLELFDSGCILWAREAVCICDDAIYALTNHGVTRIDESGVKYVSERIANFVAYGKGFLGDDAPPGTYMVADQDVGNVYLWFGNILRNAEEYASVDALVYNTRTDQFWCIGNASYLFGDSLSFPYTYAGIQDPNDSRMVYGMAASGETLMVESYKDVASDPVTGVRYYDTYNSQDNAIGIQAEFIFESPEPTHNVHWQELIINVRERTSRTINIIWGVNVEFSGGSASTSTLSADANKLNVYRVSVPSAVARSARLVVLINSPGSTGGVAYGEALNIESIEVVYSSSSHRVGTS